MKKIIKITILLFLILPCINSCGSIIRVPAGRIKTDLSRVINSISKNRDFIQNLKKRRVGKTGFYYIIDSEGVVVYHPQEVLIGRSFRNYWFVEIIVSKKTGCLRYNIGEKEQVIYFKSLNEDEIICLSIMSEEVSDKNSECIKPDRSLNKTPDIE